MVSLWTVFVIAIVILACFLLGTVLFRRDEVREDRRRSAAQLAGVLQRFGLKRLPNVLIDYSVGDYSGMAKRIHSFIEMFGEGEEAVIKEFDEVFDRVLEVKLKSPEARAYIQARLNESKPAAQMSAAASPITPTPTPVVPA